MVERPERHVAAFADAGADGITIHFEATPHANYALAAVRDAGCRAGLALNPGTPAEVVRELVDDVDLVLCMTVNPGWGGQRFLPGSIGQARPAARAAARGDGAGGRRRRRRGHRGPVRTGGGDRVRGRLGRVRRPRPDRLPSARSRTPRAD